MMMAVAAGSPACAAGDPYTVLALERGYVNLPFSNGYNGFCIDHALEVPEKDEKFRELDTSHAANNLDNSLIGEYLKILFVQHADRFFSKDADGRIMMVEEALPGTQLVVWHFSDGEYLTNPLTPEIQEAVELKANGMSVPDSGMAPILLDGETWVAFQFMVLEPENPRINNFFAYQVRTVVSGGGVAGIPQPAVPVTGDTAPLVVWTALAGTSFAGMLLIAHRRRSAN